MKSEITYRGKLFEIEQTTMPDGRVLEVARRAPGVRIIIANKKEYKLLLTKEFRRELNDWDYRLPGGKVFDTLEEYDAFSSSGQDIHVPVEQKVKGEGSGIDISAAKFIKVSTLGATVEWDLYVYEATDWKPHNDGQQLETGEQIEADNWFDYAEAQQMILDGKMQEERVALILLQWLAQQNT